MIGIEFLVCSSNYLVSLYYWFQGCTAFIFVFGMDSFSPVTRGFLAWTALLLGREVDCWYQAICFIFNFFAPALFCASKYGFAFSKQYKYP